MFKILAIPFDRASKTFDDEILCRFVSNKAIKSWQASFFQDSQETYWTVLLECDPLMGPESEKDKPPELNETQKRLYEQLRIWRKQQAEQDGIPPFIIATNSELASVVKLAPVSLEQLQTLKGFGKGKVGKYGKRMIDIVKGFKEQ